MRRATKRPRISSPLTEPELNVLLSLAEGRRHGYGMMLETGERTDGRVDMGAGTLYGVLKRMVNEGLIEESEHQPPNGGTEDGRRRYYELTRAGGEVLVEEIKRMRGHIGTARERNVLSRWGDDNDALSTRATDRVRNGLAGPGAARACMTARR